MKSDFFKGVTNEQANVLVVLKSNSFVRKISTTIVSVYIEKDESWYILLFYVAMINFVAETYFCCCKTVHGKTTDD